MLVMVPLTASSHQSGRDPPSSMSLSRSKLNSPSARPLLAEIDANDDRAEVMNVIGSVRGKRAIVVDDEHYQHDGYGSVILASTQSFFDSRLEVLQRKVACANGQDAIDRADAVFVCQAIGIVARGINTRLRTCIGRYWSNSVRVSDLSFFIIGRHA